LTGLHIHDLSAGFPKFQFWPGYLIHSHILDSKLLTSVAVTKQMKLKLSTYVALN